MNRIAISFLIALSMLCGGCAGQSTSLARLRGGSFNWPWTSRQSESITAKRIPLSSTVCARDDQDTTTETVVAGVDSEMDSETTNPERRQILPVSLEEGEVPPQPSAEGDVGRRSFQWPHQLERESFPIDIVTVVRLVNDNSPAIQFSRARLAEAQARADAANLQWLPNLTAGAAYNRFDGQTQNQRGDIFSVSRSNLFANGGVGLSLDFAEAVYRPLIERRLAAAEAQRANATNLSAELDAILAYLDLIQMYGLLEINSQALEKGEAMLIAAENAQRAKLDRSPGDVNRVKTEILLRRQERLDLIGRANVASTRLGKLLLLRSSVRLIPVNSEIVPIALVDVDQSSLDDLVATAVQNRPDLAANREFLAAAWERVRKAQNGPLLPKLQATDQGGSFGGGLNSTVGDYQGRNVLTGIVYWELKNLGFGNQIEVTERKANAEQARYQLLETQARLAAEVVEAAQVAEAKIQTLNLAEEAVKEATELYRINQEGTFNVVDAKNLFDALRPLQAIQLLQQTRQNYLAAVVDYNRAQYRLYTAIGCPQISAMPLN